MTAIRKRAVPAPPVDHAPTADLATIGAIKAFANGEASAHQQRKVWDFIVKELSGIGRQSFRSGDALGMAFMEGRRFIAQHLIAHATADTAAMKGES